MKQAQSGSVLLIVLTFLALSVALIKLFLTQSYLRAEALREERAGNHAQLLALNGLTLACQELAPAHQRTESQEQEPAVHAAQLLANLNHWQTFELSPEHEGTSGTISFAISCESGKLPLNKLYDSPSKQITQRFKPLFSLLDRYCSPDPLKLPVLTRLEAFFKKESEPLVDPSQLARVLNLARWYQPAPYLLSKKPIESRPIALHDLVSPWNEEEQINLLFSSDAVRALLGINRRPLARLSPAERKEQFALLLTSLASTQGSDLVERWGQLEPIFGKLPEHVRKLAAILTQEIEPSVFSVVSSGTVDGVQRQLVAIVKRRAQAANAPARKQNYATCFAHDRITIERIYWVNDVEYA